MVIGTISHEFIVFNERQLHVRQVNDQLKCNVRWYIVEFINLCILSLEGKVSIKWARQEIDTVQNKLSVWACFMTGVINTKKKYQLFKKNNSFHQDSQGKSEIFPLQSRKIKGKFHFSGQQRKQILNNNTLKLQGSLQKRYGIQILNFIWWGIESVFVQTHHKTLLLTAVLIDFSLKTFSLSLLCVHIHLSSGDPLIVRYQFPLFIPLCFFFNCLVLSFSCKTVVHCLININYCAQINYSLKILHFYIFRIILHQQVI